MKAFILSFIIFIPLVGFSQYQSIQRSVPGFQILKIQHQSGEMRHDDSQKYNENANIKSSSLFAWKLKSQEPDTAYVFNRHKNFVRYSNYLIPDFLKGFAKDTVVLDSILEFSYTSLQDSILIFRKSYEYNPNGFLVSSLISSLDTIKGKLINEQKIERYPNEIGNDTLIIYLNWDKQYNKWTNNNKEIYSYNSEGRLDFAQLLEWDKFSRIWVKREMIEAEYNEAGILISKASYIWNTAAEIWRGYNKWWSDTLATETGYIESNIEYAWNNQIKDWDIVLRSDVAISNEENIEYEATYKWNGQDSNWVGELKTEYYFNSLMYEQGQYYSLWDTEVSGWLQNRKTIEKFNEFWQLQSHSDYLWENEKWMLFAKTENQYNDANQRIRMAEMHRPDTIVLSKLITGFNSLDDIARTGGENSCPDKTCLETDTGLTAENSVIKWNYNINKLNFQQGYVQLELDNDLSFKGDSAISLSYKNIIASSSWFDIILADDDGEEWLYSSNEIVNDVDLKWEKLVVPFRNFKIPTNALHANNKLDLHQIGKIILRIKLVSGITSGGSIQLDSLGTYKILKTDTWFTQAEERFYYDDNNNLIADTSFMWDSAGETLMPAHSGNYKYDENNNQIVSESFNNSETNDWIGELRIESEYNSGNFETSRIIYNWSMDSSDWIPVSREISTYNQFNWQTSLESYIWNDDSGSWLLMSETKQQYDEYGTQVSYSYLSLDIIDSTWYGNKNVMVLNINSEPVQDQYYKWNNEQNDWELLVKYNRTRVENIFENDLLLISILKEWNRTFSGWMPSRKMYFFYTNKQIETMANQFHDSDILVYPNPAQDFIIIGLPENQTAHVCIFSPGGQKLLNKNLYNKTNILKTAKLGTGFYFIRIETEDETITKKIIVQK